MMNFDFDHKYFLHQSSKNHTCELQQHISKEIKKEFQIDNISTYLNLADMIKMDNHLQWRDAYNKIKNETKNSFMPNEGTFKNEFYKTRNLIYPKIEKYDVFEIYQDKFGK